MATCVWVGGGQNISQAMLFTGTAVATGGVWSLVSGTGRLVSYTILAADTVATAITAFLALLQSNNAPPEFGEITFASPSTTTITLTAGTQGTPFTMTKSQSGGATCTLATTQANVSQSDVTNASNWLRNLVNQIPQNGDDVILQNSSVPLLWNLDQLSGVLLNSWTRYQSFTARVGLPAWNALGYYEYRPTYLKLASNVNPAVNSFPLVLGLGSGSGPTLERYDMQSYKTTVTAIAAGGASDTYNIRFLGSNALNALNIVGVSVGVCMLPTEAVPNGASLAFATVDGGGTLDCGPGCAFSGTAGGGTLTISGGTSTLFCTPSVVAKNGATITLSALNGTYASITANNGVQLTTTVAMTVSSISLLKSSNWDNSGNLGAITATSATIDGDTCQVNDANNTITWPNGITVNGQVSSGPVLFTGPRNLKVV